MGERDSVRYVLTMTEKQARCVVAALDLAIRIRLGQWNEIVEQCLDCDYDDIDEYLKRKEDAVHILEQAREIVMPELEGKIMACSYGVYKFDYTERAFNVLKAVRACLAWNENPEGGITVNFDKPFAVHVAEEMPKCEAIEDAKGHKAADGGTA